MIDLQSTDEELFFKVYVQQTSETSFTSFCIICHAQVFGDDLDEVTEDIMQHLNEAHLRA